MTHRKHASFAVIGLGTFGRTVALELSRFGNHVLAIDMSESLVNDIADDVAEAVIADSRDEEALREAGLANYEAALVAIGEDLEANILCTMNLKKLGVETVWVKALNRMHHRILTKLGADRIIEPEREVGQHVAQKLNNPLLRDYVSLGNGFHIVEIEIPERHDGTPVADLELEKRYELRCLGLMRGTEYIDCAARDTQMKAGDQILLLGRREGLRKFGKSL